MRIQYLGNKAYGSVRVGDHANLNDAELLTIGDKVYEVESGGGVGPGRVSVAKGASAAAFIAALVTAINNNKPSIPVSAYIDPTDTAVCRIEADNRGALGNMVFTETFADADNVITGSGTLEYGENATLQTYARGEHTVTALDVSAGNIMIATGLAGPRFFSIAARSSAGAPKAINGNQTVDGSRLKIAQGGTTYVAGDKITWEAWE